MTHDEAVQIGYAVLRTYDKATAHDVSVVKNVVAALDGVGLLARPGELDAARATIERVRELHHGVDEHGDGADTWCAVCLSGEWPCETIRALDAAPTRKDDR